MNQKNILIATLIAVVVGLIAFSFNDFVGSTISGSPGMQEMTTLEMDTPEVEQGDYAFATLYPGKRCTEKELMLVNGEEMPFSDRKNIKFVNTKSKTRYCEESVVYYRTGGSWTPGTYVIKAKDISSGTWAETEFTVIEG